MNHAAYNAEATVEAWLRRRCRLELSIEQAGITAALALGMPHPIGRETARKAEIAAMLKIKSELARSGCDFLRVGRSLESMQD